ncbi:hypothetical protein B0H14DRAFT_2168939, partial [Mycena olivaceomarginata]
DNASSNDTQTDTMSDQPGNSFNARNRVRCIAHTLNLAVKSILKPFSAPEKKKKRDGDEEAEGEAEDDDDD